MTAPSPPESSPRAPSRLARLFPVGASLLIVLILLVPAAAAFANPPATSTGVAPTTSSPISGAPAPSESPTMEFPAPPSTATPLALPSHSFAWLEQMRDRTTVSQPATTPADFASQAGTVFLANGTISKGVLPAKNVAYPLSVAYDPIDGTVFVAGAYTATVGQYDPSNGSLVTFTQLAYVIGNPNVPLTQILALQYDAALGTLFAATPFLGGIEAINASTGAVVSFYPLGANATPDALALDSSGSTLFVADYSNDSVDALNAATGAIEWNASVGQGPDALAFDSATNEVFSANLDSANDSIVDVASGTTTGSIPVGLGPDSLALVPSNGALWTLNGAGGNVSVYSGGTLTSLSLPTNSAGSAASLVLDAARNTMFVLNAPQGELATFNATSDTASAEVVTGGLPYQAAYDPADGYLAISNISSDSLTEVDDSTNSVAHVFRLGAYPSATVFDAVSDVVYVADASVNWITELDAVTDDVVGTIALTSPADDLTFASSANLIAVTEVGGSIAFLDTSSNSITGTWSPDNGTTFIDGAYGNGEFFFTANSPTATPLTFDDEVFIVSASGFAEIADVVAGGNNSAPVYDSTTRYVDVVSNGSVIEISSVTDAYYGSIGIPVLSGQWEGLAWDNVSNELYAGVLGTGWIAVVNLTDSTNDYVVMLSSYPPDSTFIDPNTVVYVRQTNTVYVTDIFNGYTYSIVKDGVYSYSVNSQATGIGPSGLGFSVLSGLLYVANSESGTVTLLTISLNTLEPMVVDLTISPATVELGAAVTLGATATYPEWSDNFNYSGLPGACPNVNKTLWTCTAGAANSFTVTVKAKNPFGVTATASASFVVFQPLTLISFTATPTVLTLGSSFRAVVSDSGGVAPLTVGYPVRPTGCAATASVNWTCTPSASGNYTLQVDVSDATGNTLEANLSITVNPHLSIAFALSTNSSVAGHPVTFTVLVTGGTAPYAFTYTGLPAGCAAANTSTISCSPTTAGVYPVLVQVVDSSAASQTATVTLVVSSSGSTGSNGGSGLSTTDLLLIVVIVVIVAIAVVALATRRRGASPESAPRSRPSAPPEEEGTMEEAEPSPTPPSEAPAEMIMPPPAPRRAVIPVAAAPPPNNPNAPAAGAIEGEPEKQYYQGSNVVAASTASSQRASLVCPNCGTVNESWLTNCRKCKRSLFSTGGA